MDNSIFPVAVHPSQIAIFKEKADYLADSIRSHFEIKVSKFKRYDYLALALGYKSYNDLIKSTEFRKDSDKLTPLSIFDERPIIESIAEVFSAKTDGLSKENCASIIYRLSSDKTPEQWTIADYVDPNQFYEPPSSILSLARSASDQYLPEMVLHSRDYSTLDSASKEEAEAIFSNVSARLVMRDDEPNEASNLFKDRGEINMAEVIASNPVTIVNLDSMARSAPGRKALSHIAQSAQRLQSSEVHKEKKRLTLLLQPEQELSDVCEHKITDYFHNKETGLTQSKCIVCGHQWVESEPLLKTNFKHWERISGGKLVGQYKEKKRLYIGTAFGPSHKLIESEVKELMAEMKLIKDAGGIANLENKPTPHHLGEEEPSEEILSLLNKRANDFDLLFKK